MRVKLFVFIFCLTAVFAQDFSTNIASNIVSNENTNASVSVEGEKPSKGIFSHSADIVVYYRFANLIEQTGNEDSICAYFRGFLAYEKEFKKWTTRGEVDGVFMQSVSLRARVREEMSAPAVVLNKAFIVAKNRFVEISGGINRPLSWVLPMKSYFPAYMYYISQASINTVVTGSRDTPLVYDGPIPRVDTGFYLGLTVKDFRLKLGMVNGEEGLDANSAKTIAYLIGVSNEIVFAGSSGQIGNVGSIPIKEWGHIYKAFVFFGKNHIAGVDASFLVHGVRNSSISPFDSNMYEALVNQYGYSRSFFGSYSLPNLDEPTQPLLGLSAYFYFKFNKVLKERFTFDGHIGFYDPNLKSDEYDFYRRKYRGVGRVITHFNESLSLIFSYTHTYDEVYFNNYQFYEREPRFTTNESGQEVELHYQRDNDIFLGLKFSF